MDKLSKEEKKEWLELRERMLTWLDDTESERFEKFKRVAEKKLRRRGLEEPPIDKAAVIRFLLLYGQMNKRQGLCIKESGIDKVMLLTAYDLWPESHFVRNYICAMRRRINEMENEDILDEAREGLRRLNTEDDCKINAKTVMFTVAGLDKENFGKKEDGAKDTRQQINYSFPNLNLTMIMSPAEIERKNISAIEHGEVIDVEEVKV